RVRAFGKILGVHRDRGRGGVMHIRFTRVTRQHLNRISEFVYDFSKPTTTGQIRQQMDRAVQGRGMRPGRPPAGPALPRGPIGPGGNAAK
ncbi:MAG TPA: hypothetical protein VMF68_09215, partial [Spirochaetia bacterium]|nr:hypothetical protein [Spirochaetia bacterium]